jgi:hypothetical protein
MGCPHFCELSRRCEELVAKFLQSQFDAERADPAGHKLDFDQLAAFRLLLHAEVENFLEQKATENISALRVRMDLDRHYRKMPACLFSLAVALCVEVDRPRCADQRVISKSAAALLAEATKFIRDNNGIKGNSFFVLSLCAGKTVDEIDEALSASLNSYGKRRGEVAHQSMKNCQNFNAPSEELRAARDIVKQLGDYFDATSHTAR